MTNFIKSLYLFCFNCSKVFILVFLFSNCSVDNSAKNDNPVSVEEYIPPKMGYLSILKQMNPKTGSLIFDTDNVCLRYFDGKNWELISNLKGENEFRKSLNDVDNSIPDNLNQIGWYKNSWYVVKSTSVKPYWLKVAYNYDFLPEIVLGDKLEKKRIIISDYNEQFTHDSKIFIKDGVGYVAYYSNVLSKDEGEKNQAIRLVVFNLQNPLEKEFYNVFQPNYKYNSIKTDYLAAYTPIIFLTKENKIRILGRLCVNFAERYYFRDFDPVTKELSEPELCKIKNKDNSLVDFNTKNVEKYVNNLFGIDFVVPKNKNFMFLVSENVFKGDYLYVGLTLGEFTADKLQNTGTTLLMRTKDDGKTFECMGAPDPSKIDSKYNKQFVEGAFDFTGDNEITMLGRNDVAGLMISTSIDGGMTFSNPISLNDEYGLNTKASKPLFKNMGNGNFLTIWNTQENYIDPNAGYSDRTVLDIRYGNNKNIQGNKLKARVRSYNGCHYPSIANYQNDWFLTLSGGYRKITAKNVSDISILQISNSDLEN
jgi:hypothetical protein